MYSPLISDLHSPSSGERTGNSLNLLNRVLSNHFGGEMMQKDPSPHVYRVLQDSYVCLLDRRGRG